MKKKLILFAIPILCMSLVFVACDASKVSGYVNLAVEAVENGLTLAQSFGAQVSADTVSKVSKLGTDVTSAFSAWASASATDKPGKWAAVQTALDAFKAYLPQALADAGVDPKFTAYASIVSLAITAVEAAVNIVEQQNPTVSAKKKLVAPISVSHFKKTYDQEMVSAGHPELKLK